jgi:hypothetical protein
MPTDNAVLEILREAKKLAQRRATAGAATAVAGMIVPVPWRLVREAAISLNNDSSSPKAAAAVINGLVSYFSIQRPSEDVVIALKNDQQTSIKNSVQADMEGSLKRGNLATTATLVEQLIKIEKDSNEVAALKQLRAAIAAKRRSNKIKFWGWSAAALIFISLMAIGSQDKPSSSGGRVAVTRNPSAEWLAQQMAEAFPWNTAPTYLVRDNDRAYGQAFQRRIRAMGIRDRPISPSSPWQKGSNPPTS